jgi:hypothetical protein
VFSEFELEKLWKRIPKFYTKAKMEDRKETGG